MARLWTTVVVELPSGHSKGGGFSSAALEGSAALPSGAVPRTVQRAPTQEPALQKRRIVFRPGVLACLCRGFPGSGSLVLWPCPFGFLFVLVPPRVSFYWPRASRSSSQREGRRVKLRGTDPRTGTGRRPKDRLLQVSLYLRRCCVPRRACLALPLPLCYFMFYCVCGSRCQLAGFYEISLQSTLSCTFLDARLTCHTQFPSTKVSFCITPSFVWQAVTSQCFS